MIRNISIILLLTLAIILSSCTNQVEISNMEYYKNGQDYLELKDYEKSLENFNLALEKGYNDQAGELKNLIAILENYSLSKNLYAENKVEMASEKAYLIRDYEKYVISDDIDKLKKDIHEDLEESSKKNRVRYVDEVLEDEIIHLKESANISLEEASQRVKLNLEKQVSIEDVEELNIISDDALWYYFNAYDEEYEVSYYVNSKTGEIVEDRIYDED